MRTKIESLNQGKQKAQDLYTAINNTIYPVGQNVKVPWNAEYCRLMAHLDTIQGKILQSITACPIKRKRRRRHKGTINRELEAVKR